LLIECKQYVILRGRWNGKENAWDCRNKTPLYELF
jgi:hypothetical protein